MNFLQWQRGFGTIVTATVADGDANRDGSADANDFAVWQNQYANSTETTFEFHLEGEVVDINSTAALLAAYEADTIENKFVGKRNLISHRLAYRDAVFEKLPEPGSWALEPTNNSLAKAARVAAANSTATSQYSDQSFDSVVADPIETDFFDFVPPS